jgi:aspartate kinase
MDFIVCKFGGTSVAAPERLRQIESIIELDERRRCVVVSAPGKAPGVEFKVTDMLIKITELRLAAQDASPMIMAVKKRFEDIYGALGLSSQLIGEILADLDVRANVATTDARKFRDQLVAIGEDLNARLFAAYLQSRGKAARYVSPAEAGLLVTAQFGDAQPLAESTMRLASLKQICSESLVIFPGFFGVTSDGDVATFSRGGSDLTGSILAEALDACEYENWTDVDGIYSANPGVVSAPVQIPALTYKEMRELSYMGFNVFHEEAVKPVIAKKIPIRLRNTNNINNKGTLIVYERLPGERDVVGIASSSGYCSFNLQKFLMNRERGFGRKLLQIFEDYGLSYEHAPSGIDNMSVILSQKQLAPVTLNNIIRSIEDKLKPDEIKTEFGIALIVVVGEGLLHKLGMLSRATKALSQAGVNIKIANQGSSEISMIFGIDASDEKKAVNALYQEFFAQA